MKSCQVDTELLIHTQTFHLKKNDDNNDQIEIGIECSQDQMPMEPIAISTETRQQNTLQIREPLFLRYCLDKSKILLWNCNNNPPKSFD